MNFSYKRNDNINYPQNLYQFLFAGDEILAINGKSLQGMSHDEAINEFRAIKHGPVILRVARRDPALNLDQDPLVLVKE